MNPHQTAYIGMSTLNGYNYMHVYLFNVESPDRMNVIIFLLCGLSDAYTLRTISTVQ